MFQNPTPVWQWMMMSSVLMVSSVHPGAARRARDLLRTPSIKWSSCSTWPFGKTLEVFFGFFWYMTWFMCFCRAPQKLNKTHYEWCMGPLKAPNKPFQRPTTVDRSCFKSCSNITKRTFLNAKESAWQVTPINRRRRAGDSCMICVAMSQLVSELKRLRSWGHIIPSGKIEATNLQKYWARCNGCLHVQEVASLLRLWETPLATLAQQGS